MPTYGAKVVRHDARRVIDFPLHPLTQLVKSSDLSAAFSLFDVEIAPKAPGAPPHTHTFEDEVYYVLDGEMTFLLGDHVETAPRGSTVILPRGIAHATWNEGDEPATALTIVSQHSKFEGFFDDVVERIRARGIIGPAQMAAVVGESGPDYGVTIDMSLLPERAFPIFGVPTTA